MRSSLNSLPKHEAPEQTLGSELLVGSRGLRFPAHSHFAGTGRATPEQLSPGNEIISGAVFHSLTPSSPTPPLAALWCSAPLHLHFLVGKL